MNRISQETLDIFKNALSPGNNDPDLLRKAFVQSGSAVDGLTAYPLEAPAKNLAPLPPTPLRNRTPRVGGGTGLGPNWRAVTKLDANGIDVSVAEGKRGGDVSTTVSPFLAAFAGIGIEDSVTFEAQYAAEGFQDVRALAVANQLRVLMVGEERVLVGGQGTWPLGDNGAGGRTPTPSGTLLADADVLGTMTQQATACYAVALTLAGYRRASVANGLPGQITRSRMGPYGGSDVINGGNAKVSLESALQTTDATHHAVDWFVTAVPGAYAYAWYTGPTGAVNCALTAITTTNTFRQLADATGTQKANDAKVAADYSRNSLAFDGLTTLAAKSGSGSFYRSLDGADLTGDGVGGVIEIDEMLEAFYNVGGHGIQSGGLYLSPTHLDVSPSDIVALSRKIMKGAPTGGVPLVRVNVNEGQTSFQGGGMIAKNYLNKITGEMIEIEINPALPAGKMVASAVRVPYPLSGVGSVYRVLTRQEYYTIQWPLAQRAWESGVYADEVFQHYFPPSIGILDNGIITAA